MRETVVTCHECRTQSTYHVKEWPPQMFVCGECSSIFQLEDLNVNDEPIFKLVGYCRYEQ